MKTLTVVLATLALSGAPTAADTVNFDGAAIGLAPAAWTATRTGTGDARWTVERDDTAPSKPNVLKQSGVATYPVAFKNDTSVKDGVVEVGRQRDVVRRFQLRRQIASSR